MPPKLTAISATFGRFLFASTTTKASKPSDKDFSKHVNSIRSDMHAATNRLTGGHISVDGWADEMDHYLQTGHTEAWILGRKRAGDDSEASHEDTLMGREFKDRESTWLGNFIDDLKGDRYKNDDDTWKESAIKTRVDLYAQKLRGTANQAWVEVGDEDGDEYYWELGAAEDHCDDCPEIAADNPYTKDTLYAYPCSGDTECLGNCNCTIKRVRDEKSSYGFGPVDLAD